MKKLTKLQQIEKQYGKDFGEKSFLNMRTYLKKRGYKCLADTLLADKLVDNQMLPKPRKVKLINMKEFIKLAKSIQKAELAIQPLEKNYYSVCDMGKKINEIIDYLNKKYETNKLE